MPNGRSSSQRGVKRKISHFQDEATPHHITSIDGLQVLIHEAVSLLQEPSAFPPKRRKGNQTQVISAANSETALDVHSKYVTLSRPALPLVSTPLLETSDNASHLISLGNFP
jgi:hypothetical protein